MAITASSSCPKAATYLWQTPSFQKLVWVVYGGLYPIMKRENEVEGVVAVKMAELASKARYQAVTKALDRSMNP